MAAGAVTAFGATKTSMIGVANTNFDLGGLVATDLKSSPHDDLAEPR
jgi:hypothetical protein